EVLWAEFGDEYRMCNWLHSLLSALRTGKLVGRVMLEVAVLGEEGEREDQEGEEAQVEAAG
ncbi:MAG: hypothetical protein DRJ67_12635, partial [Thermoprotei archaeon]